MMKKGLKQIIIGEGESQLPVSCGRSISGNCICIWNYVLEIGTYGNYNRDRILTDHK